MYTYKQKEKFASNIPSTTFRCLQINYISQIKRNVNTLQFQETAGGWSIFTDINVAIYSSLITKENLLRRSIWIYLRLFLPTPNV